MSKKRKWWLCKPRGNCPPSRKWQRFRYGRGGVVCNEDAMCGEKIVEIGIFNDDFPVGRLVRIAYSKPFNCKDEADKVAAFLMKDAHSQGG